MREKDIKNPYKYYALECQSIRERIIGAPPKEKERLRQRLQESKKKLEQYA